MAQKTRTGSTPSDQAASSRTKPNPIAVSKALKGVDFPKDKNELVAHARGAGDDSVIAALERLPNRRYSSMADVERGVGEED